MSLDWSKFEEAREAFAALGFNVIPLPPGSKGAQGSGVRFAHLNKRTSRRITDRDVESWRRLFERRKFEGIVGAYLLPASSSGWTFAIVDVDDPELDARAVEIFGDSPLRTLRAGRVKHRFFRIDRPPSEAHLIGALGPRSIDVIASTGVVLPGSIHPSGEAYESSVPIEDLSPRWISDNLPSLDTSKIRQLREERRASAIWEIKRGDSIDSTAEGFLHAEAPVDLGASMWCGHILPDTEIETADGTKKRIVDLTPGEKVFATYREDRSPSSHVTVYNGRRYFWDMSSEPRRYWTMVEPLSSSTDPELDISAPMDLAIERLGVEVVTLPDDGWISDQIPEIGEDETVLIRAPHGVGKTVLAKREHARAETSISVCNTQALTIANASVLQIRAVYEGVDESEPRVSVCIPSLPRFTSPPEFFHVDEADAVHGFLHSGKVEDPLEAWKTLAFFASRSKRCLMTSADLTFEDIALFVHAIRERHAARKIRVYIRPPSKRKEKILIRSTSVARAAIHLSLEERHPRPVFVGITTRKIAGQIAQGYRSASSMETIDLDDIASSVIDTPTPHPVDLGPGLPSADVDRPFFVSGENNRYFETVRWLEDTGELVDRHDLIVTSPAVQSGVSLDREIQRCIILHENREVPAESVLQIARRPRHLSEPVIVIGVRRWTVRPHRTDRAYLDDLVLKKAKTTVRAISKILPKFAELHSTKSDPEFLWSWRITARRQIRSYSDPLGTLIQVAKTHGFDLDIDTDRDGDSASFSEIVTRARHLRTEVDAVEVSEAEEIDKDERERLERAPKLFDGERQSLDRDSLERFYGREATPDLVIRDNGGRYRAKVRAYTHARLFVTCPEVLAYADHLAGDGKQPTQLRHVYATGALLSGLFSHVLDRPFDGDAVEFYVDEVREKISNWWLAYHKTATAFFPRLRGPAPDFEARWFGDRLRSMGASMMTRGASSKRRKIATFEQIDDLSAAYAERLITEHEKERDKEWTEKLRSKFGA
jgi:hypothetical protein